MTSWTDIHEGFSEYWQQRWEEANITKEEAKEWKNLNFSATETKIWLEVGLDKYKEEFASWLRTNNHIPELVKNNLEQLRSDYEEFIRYGLCDKCQKTNTSENWCQPCAEKEWKQLSGQTLINKFVKQEGKDRMLWIPYEEFINIEYLAEGGFSKIYKAKWKIKKHDREVVLKSLTNSQNITLEFLTEVLNTKLVSSEYNHIVECYGISWNPQTKNYVMVMDYMKDGNLRQVLQQKNKKISLENKLEKLKNIANGLIYIHDQNLIHRDFHSGNILSNGSYHTSITDLGLSKPVNIQPETSKIFGVLPYVAPEVLRGQPYTQKSDIYSFGIIMYELLTNSYPYPEMNDLDLSLKVCNGYRPNLDKVPLPQLLKDLVKRCWNVDPTQRPSAEELERIIDSWYSYGIKTNTEFYQQYQTLEKKYNTFSLNTPYQIHPNAITTSKMIDTKIITQQLEIYSQSLAMDFTNLNLEDKQEEQIQTQQEIPPKQ